MIFQNHNPVCVQFVLLRLCPCGWDKARNNAHAFSKSFPTKAVLCRSNRHFNISNSLQAYVASMILKAPKSCATYQTVRICAVVRTDLKQSKHLYSSPACQTPQTHVNIRRIHLRLAIITPQSGAGSWTKGSFAPHHAVSHSSSNTADRLRVRKQNSVLILNAATGCLLKQKKNNFEISVSILSNKNNRSYHGAR